MTREEAIKTLKGEAWICCVEKWNEALDMAIKALEQEPFINKPCVSSKVCEHDKNNVLDKIRAEIKKNSYPIVHGVNNHEFGMTLYGILQVLDKYKYEAESEVENEKK